MWFSTYILALLVSGIASVPIQPPIQRTFIYRAENQVFNDAAPDHVSKWDMHAKLIYQTLPEYSVIKFDKIQVSAFNGLLKDHKKATMIDIPVEAKVLTEPFIFYHNNTIGVGQDEPNWSLNMKRSIASILYIKQDFTVQDLKNEKMIVEEDNMYGSCNVTYKLGEKEGRVVLDKIIDIDQCGGEIQSYWSANKVVDCGMEHEQFYREATRKYVFSGKELSHVQNKQIDSISTKSLITFHPTPGDKHKIQYRQTQYIEKLDYSDAKTPLDVSKMTFNANLKFEHGTKPMDGRSDDKSTHELSKNVLDSLLKLKNELIEPTATNSWEISDSVIEVWGGMNGITLPAFRDVLDRAKDDQVMNDMVLYFLPYIGTDDSLMFMQQLIGSDQIDLYQTFRMISLFPNFVNAYDKDMMNNMTALLNLPTENKLVRNGGILGYSQLIYRAYKSENVDKDTFDKTVQTYLNKFKTSEDYESRMVYLLGLHNLNVDLDILLPIINDPNESHHLRLIAIDSAADELREQGEKVKHTFMTMLKNDSLVFELRVAALNVLLGTEMYQEDYDQIYEYLKDESGDQSHKHLYNYFYSTLSSYAVNTKCKNPMSEISDMYLPELEPPHSMDTALTGNYRLSFTNDGPDYGLTTQVKMISEPTTKSPELIQITYESFHLGLKTKKTYHLKVHGVLDEFIEKTIKTRSIDTRHIKQFLDIIKKHGLTVPQKNDVHIELIVYENDKAVFATHYDLEYLRNNNLKKQLTQLMDTLLGDHTYVVFPIMDYLHLPSDLGTDMTLCLEEELLGYDASKDIGSLFDMEEFECAFKYKSMTNIKKTIDVYNPISSMKLGASSLVMDNSYVEIKFKVETDDSDFYVEFNNNDVIYDSEFEIVKVTHVDNETLLHTYCADCEDVLIFEGEQHESYEKTFNTTLSGYHITNTVKGSDSNDDEKFLISLEKSLSSTVGNFEVFPLSFFWYVLQNYIYHNHYTPNWDRLKDRTQIVPDKENPLKTQLRYYLDYDEETADNEVIPGSFGILSISSDVKTIKQDKLMEHVNVSLSFHDSPGLYNQSYRLSVDYNDHENTYSKVCLDFDIKYPKLLPDYYSIEPAEPTKGRFMLMFDMDSKPISVCDHDSMITLEVNGLFSVMEEQQKMLMSRANSPLKQCLKDSEGLKYAAPTDACQKASAEMSTYRKYDFNGVFIMNNKIKNIIDDNDIYDMDMVMKFLEENGEVLKGSTNVTIELLNSKFKGYQTDDDGSVEEIDDSLIKFLSPTYRQAYIEDQMLVSSKDLLDDMDEFEYGLTSSCHVTSRFVNTFTEQTIRNYTHGQADELVGMIDCDNAVNGFTFSVVQTNRLKLTAWTTGYKITVEPYQRGIKVAIDDQPLTENNFFKSRQLQVYPIADDVLFIKSNAMQLYYNTEYIRAEIYASYINKLCGLCAKNHQIITP